MKYQVKILIHVTCNSQGDNLITKDMDECMNECMDECNGYLIVITGIDISSHSKVGYLNDIVLSDQTVSCGQISVNKVVVRQIFATFESIMKESKFRNNLIINYKY